MVLNHHLRHRSCPVCNLDKAIILYFNKMAVLGGLDMSYQVSMCSNCEFVYASDLPATSAYNNYYRTLSKYDVMDSVKQIRPVDRKRALAAVELCKPYIDEQAIIADIGCGSGHLLSVFAEQGWQNLFGIDPAPNAASKAEYLFGLKNVCSGTLQDAGQLLPLREATLVCMTGVLEHLAELREELSLFVTSLEDKTSLLIEVPALECFIREPMEVYGEFSLEHIQYFSQKSLEQLLSGLGYACFDSRIVAFGYSVSDSIFALFSKNKQANVSNNFKSVGIQNYIVKSEASMESLLKRIQRGTAQQIVIYGAGSHSARLLPRLEEIGLIEKVVAVVDANPNLLGQQFGSYLVTKPDQIKHWPNATVVVSSFVAEHAIESYVKANFSNPVLCLYAE
jgi:SAM-dependent methyltransferase